MSTLRRHRVLSVLMVVVVVGGASAAGGVAAAASRGAGSASALPAECSSDALFQVTCSYTASGTYSLTLPSGAEDVGLVAVGGTGGGTNGGLGARVTALHGPAFGQTFSIVVGQNGGSSDALFGGASPGAPNSVGGGGGASSVSAPLFPGDIVEPVIVAAGGGGAGSGGTSGANGGAAGLPGASAGSGGGGGGMAGVVKQLGTIQGGAGGTLAAGSCDAYAAGASASGTTGRGYGSPGGAGGSVSPVSAGGGGGGAGGYDGVTNNNFAGGGAGGGGGALCGVYDTHGILRWTRYAGGGGGGGASFASPVSTFINSIQDKASAPGGTPEVVVSYRLAPNACSAPDAQGHVVCGFSTPGTYPVSIPSTATDITVVAAGAQGGWVRKDIIKTPAWVYGGLGASVSASFGSALAGQSLSVGIGAMGENGGVGCTCAAGGAGGGGAGGISHTPQPGTSPLWYGAGGGGATTFGSEVVAGGGGGAGMSASTSSIPGVGGNAASGGGIGAPVGGAVTGASGGRGGQGSISGSAASGGIGGNATGCSINRHGGGGGDGAANIGGAGGGVPTSFTPAGYPGGGGGGGVVGGGGGGQGAACAMSTGNWLMAGGGGGGGGSSMADPVATGVTINEGAGAPNGRDGWLVLTYTIPPPIVTTWTAPPLLQKSPFTATFSRPVMGVDATDFTVVEVGPIPVSGTVSCLDASNAPVNCTTGPVTTAQFTPSTALWAGEYYFINVNPAAAGITGYPDGVPAAAQQGYVRAQSSFTSAQYPLKYAWGSVANTAALGGSYLQDTYPAASETFSFTGTSLDLIMWEGPDRGTATVTISQPGSPTITQDIDTYKATAADKNFSWTCLTNVKHTVKISVDGAKSPSSTGTAIGFDGVQVNGSPATPALTAAWSDGPGFGYRFSGQKGATLTVNYRGTGVTWNALVGPNDGKASVTIDGVLVGTIDLYAAGYAYQDFHLTLPGIVDTGHTLRIKALGSKNPLSTDTIITINSLTLD